MKSDVTSKHRCVNIGTSVNFAKGHITKECAHEQNQEVLKLRGDCPWYARELLWGLDEEEIGPTALYSLTADPLPRPLFLAFQNKAAMKTLSENPELFKIICLIDVDVFEGLLLNHPNPIFCRSVFDGLRYGFWPWPDKTSEYPETLDNSFRPPKNDKEKDFLIAQVKSEESAGGLSAPSGPDLLPGMYSPPVHAVPKPASEKLRMVVDHSSGIYSLNSMVDPKDIAGVKLDGIASLGTSLRSFRRAHPTSELQMFKSDVGTAYRQMPMHPLFQILTIITVDDEHRVDRCNNFGNRGSQKIWQSLFLCRRHRAPRWLARRSDRQGR